jgi:hypothetical protein
MGLLDRIKGIKKVKNTNLKKRKKNHKEKP